MTPGPSLPAAVSRRGSAVPVVKPGDFTAIRTQLHDDGTLTLEAHPSGPLLARLWGHWQELKPLAGFFASWLALGLGLGWWMEFQFLPMVAFSTLGTPLLFQLFVRFIHPRLGRRPLLFLRLTPNGWQHGAFSDGPATLPRALARSAMLVPRRGGRAAVCVTTSSGKQVFVGTHVSSQDAGQLVDLMRAYGAGG